MPKPKITTEKKALAAARRDGSALKHMPAKLKTPELCLEAVKQTGWALKFVPEPPRDEVLRSLKNAE